MRIKTDTPTTGPGRLPRWAKLHVTGSSDDPVPFDVAIDAVLENGRYVVESLSAQRTAGGPPITTEQLRLIPVGRILAEGLATLVRMTVPVSSGEARITTDPRPLADDLSTVAAIYRIAYACGLPPTKTVAEMLGLPASTANKRVIRARREGLLPATTPGRAGATD